MGKCRVLAFFYVAALPRCFSLCLIVLAHGRLSLFVYYCMHCIVEHRRACLMQRNQYCY